MKPVLLESLVQLEPLGPLALDFLFQFLAQVVEQPAESMEFLVELY